MLLITLHNLSWYWAKNFSDVNGFKEELYILYDLQASFSFLGGGVYDPLYWLIGAFLILPFQSAFSILTEKYFNREITNV